MSSAELTVTNSQSNSPAWRMRLAKVIAIALVACLSTPTLAAAATCPPSDLLIHNTTVYTADDDQWQVNAVAIRDGKFVFVGSEEAAQSWKCGATQVMDLKSSTVFPGFIDSHQHLEGVGRRTRTLSLFGIDTLSETVAEIREWAATVPAGEWVLGRGWIEREWTDEQRFLTRRDVDIVVQ